MELQTGEFPGWDRSLVAFIKKLVYTVPVCYNRYYYHTKLKIVNS